MKYERIYWIKWTWRYVNKKDCYTECKAFDTKTEANAFFFELFHNSNIEILWCQKVCEESWEKNNA